MTAPWRDSASAAPFREVAPHLTGLIDPYAEPPEAPVSGSLAGDFADIYLEPAGVRRRGSEATGGRRFGSGGSGSRVTGVST